MRLAEHSFVSAFKGIQFYSTLFKAIQDLPRGYMKKCIKFGII
jgi:hypothetical protein